MIRRLVGELIEVPGLIGDYVEDFGKALQRLTRWLRRYDPDPAIREYARTVALTPPATDFVPIDQWRALRALLRRDAGSPGGTSGYVTPPGHGIKIHDGSVGTSWACACGVTGCSPSREDARTHHSTHISHLLGRPEPTPPAADPGVGVDGGGS